MLERVRTNGSKPKSKKKQLEFYAEAITAAYVDGIAAVIECGRLLIEAKAALGHGCFSSLFNGRPIAPNYGLVPFGQETARCMMVIARNRTLSKTQFALNLPRRWTTLYALSQLPEEQLERLIKSGEVHPELKRREAAALLEGALLAQFPEALATLIRIAERYSRQSSRRRHPDPDVLFEALKDEPEWSVSLQSAYDLKSMGGYLKDLAETQCRWMEDTCYPEVALM